MQKLFEEIKTIKSIGEQRAKLFANIGVKTKVSLLLHLPFRTVDRKSELDTKKVKTGDVVSFIGEIQGYINEKKGKIIKEPFKVIVFTKTGFVNLVFFKGNSTYIKNQLPKGEKKAISGTVNKYNDEVQIVHPDYILPPQKFDELACIESIYGITKGITQKLIHHLLKQILSENIKVNEWLSSEILQKLRFSSFLESLKNIHFPKKFEDILETSSFYQRLAFDEMLASQLAFKIARKQNESNKNIEDAKLEVNEATLNTFKQKLPFALTSSQTQVIDEIIDDLKSQKITYRLLQGDVGSGKTAVAMLCILAAVESSSVQAVFMAPTNVLATQVYSSFLILENEENIVLLTGQDKGKKRQEKLQQIESGKAKVVIGTHSVFSADVNFKNLKLVFIDEQHRFGVAQRIDILKKGQNVNLVLMSATPIPRTLALSLYSDIEISLLKQKPQNRKEIITSILSKQKEAELISGIKRIIEKGQKLYWVCPLIEELIEEGEEEENISPLQSVKKRFEELQQTFGDIVALVHGGIKDDAINQTVEDFKNGKYKILVATTVIEVGIDVKDATLIVIEDAQKFGLSQLHQLRGRVGRGDLQSYCILYHGKNISKTALERLNIIKQSTDGFFIAEKDLALRGSGDIIGIKQSGYFEYKIAKIPNHLSLLSLARDYSKQVFESHFLKQSLNRAEFETLLKIFGYDIVLEYKPA